MIPSCVRQILLAISTVLILAGAVNSTAAQTPAPAAATGIVAEQRPAIDAVKKQIADYAQQMEKADTDAALADLRLNLEASAKKLLDIGVSFRPRVTEINSRLDQLGPPPAQGQPPEAQIVTDERAKLTTEKAEINAVLGETEDQLIAANRMIERTVDARRELFTNTLSQRVATKIGMRHESDALYYRRCVRIYACYRRTADQVEAK